MDASSAESGLTLSLDALVRSIGIRRGSPFAFFLGAGCSTTSGIPSAEMCVWDWKRRIFLTNNPGLENQFSEISLDGVRRRIQAWLDRQGRFPKEGSPEEYGFYIHECFPIADDRRMFFQEKVRTAVPHVGYRLLCQLAQDDLVRTVWSPNFDGMTARSAANFALTPLEVGIDSKGRIERAPKVGEIMCVSMHGDYRYDPLMNTKEELQTQEASLRAALVDQLADTSFVVAGYSGRDSSLMDALRAGMAKNGSGILYWCGYSDADMPASIAELLNYARAHGRQAYYVPTLGFDDLLTRLALHCLSGERRAAAEHTVAELSSPSRTAREPFTIQQYTAKTLIKSNAFAIECPTEVLQFDLVRWPEDRVWAHLREQLRGKRIVAVPSRGKILAFGAIDEIRDAFGANLKGPIERTPVSPSEFNFEDGAVASLMRETLVRAMAEANSLPSDGHRELWHAIRQSSGVLGTQRYETFGSVQPFLRRVADTLYLVLKPSIKVLTPEGADVPLEIAKQVKLKILGYQHNKEFNQAVNAWRSALFPGKKEPTTTYEFPPNTGSTFKFRIRRSPVFGEIGLAKGRPIRVSDELKPLLKYSGFQLAEPDLVFSNKEGTGTTVSPHPIRGIVDNRPYDFPLTMRGFHSKLRIGVVCADTEAQRFGAYLSNVNRRHTPSQSETDYLVDYPGFQTAYGLPVDIPEPDQAGWHRLPEPTADDAHAASVETARNISVGIESLQSSYAPHVVLVLFPERWSHLRGYRTDNERFDVHDFVKAYGVQRGIATQFLDESTMSDGYQCRVWWWLSLALYAKGMRTPWVLNSLAPDTAFVGLGFSIDANAPKGSHVVLGCSHIYSDKGEGLQYRLTKVENPIIRRGNPFMSRDDARRTGETIRQLFFDARFKLPDRVVLHKRTPFTRDEREGLADGLSGVAKIDMLEIQIDNAFRYVASVPRSDGSIDEDSYPVARGTAMKLDDYSALLWVHGVTSAVHPTKRYFQGKRRIPAPLTVRRHAGRTDLRQLAEEVLGLSKMNWNTLDLYTKFPATLQSSNEIARIGSLLQRFGASSYDYRLFI